MRIIKWSMWLVLAMSLCSEQSEGGGGSGANFILSSKIKQ
jgi:hypothetical protein